MKRYLTSAVLFFAWSALLDAQALDPDTIDFTTAAGYRDLKACAQNVLEINYNNIAYQEGCVTNACLCQRSTLGDAVGKVSSGVLRSCSNLDDATIAVSVLTAYCAAKGSTEVVLPTVLQSTGASTVTVTRTVAAPTVTVTHRVSVASPPVGPWRWTAGGAAVVAVVVAGGPFLWMLLWQRLRVNI